MSSMNSLKATLIDHYQQAKIKNKEPVNVRAPKEWNRDKWIQDGCLFERIGGRWYLMKEDFYEGHH